MFLSMSNTNLTVLIDDTDEWLRQWSWYCVEDRPGHYAIRRVSDSIYLARFLLGVTDPAIEVDHKNGNTLDNRRTNLRLATRSQNACNAAPYKGGKSKFKGVSWHKSNKGWQACITKNSKRYYLGCYPTEIEAAQAYDSAAIELHGEFARLNTYESVSLTETLS